MILIWILDIRNLKKNDKINNNNNSNNNNINSNNNKNNNNNKSSNDNNVNSIPSLPTSKETVFILGDNMVNEIKRFFTTMKTEP